MAEIKSWKEKILSGGGKEVMIKAMIQVIPSYIMSYFLLPIDLYREIISMISRFW